ncbi:MAG: nitroreductase family protein [Dehalococcoidales bacterium]|nr:nitroreductase family protein [Dehalococcoidales bacterium]
MDVLEAIRTRRSIRQYKNTLVDDETIKLVLEAARLAPSWANTQCWRFVVVRDSSIKNQLADMLSKNNPATNAVRNAPVVIITCAELGKAGYLRRESGERREPATDKGEYWYMFDVAISMQNLVLAAHSLGLGTVYIGAFDAKGAANILKVPDGYCVVGLTPLGYPDQNPEPRPRKEISEIVFYEEFARQ